MNEITEALNLLRRDGWTKGTTRDLTGRRCITGALRDVMGLQLHSSHQATAPQIGRWADLLHHVSDVITEQFPDRGRCFSPIGFNDDRRTTWPQVEAIMEKAARRLDEEES